jgi:hypothetical protein
MFETIIIYSIDGKEWKRYGNFLWPSYKAAEDALDIMNKYVVEEGLENCYFDLVSKEYFEKFNQPFV